MIKKLEVEVLPLQNPPNLKYPNNVILMEKINEIVDWINKSEGENFKTKLLIEIKKDPILSLEKNWEIIEILEEIINNIK